MILHEVVNFIEQRRVLLYLVDGYPPFGRAPTDES